MHSGANSVAGRNFAERDFGMSSAIETPVSGSAAAPRFFEHAIFRYGLAISSVAGATALGFLANRVDLPELLFAIFLFAIALTSWYAEVGPAILAVALSVFIVDYFFIPPLYTLRLSRQDIEYIVAFAVLSTLLIWFGVVRRQAEQRVIGRSRELEVVNKELEAFAYSVSHDLRAPIRHIAGFTELLQKHADAELDDKARRHISMIIDSANRMGILVDDLLAFSRIGRSETQKTAINLAQLVKSVVSEVAPDTERRKISWRIGDLPSCHADPAMLRLVFTNLISNAVKFTRTREHAEIEIGSLNHTPDEMAVFVKDNGVGFDMKYKDKLFGVFQRLHSQEAFEGTGIGLATVERVVRRHGGRVWAESSLDHGATFFVALPKPER